MFSILPDECLLLIIKEVLNYPNETKNPYPLMPKCFGIKTKENYSRYINRLALGIDWKKMKQFDITKKIIFWQPLPTVFILPLLLVSKEMNQIFDRNFLWNFIYINEFRKRKEYKRKPKNMKQLLKDKIKLTFNNRYNPQLKMIELNSNILRDMIKKDITSMNLLLKSLPTVKPYSEDFSDENINNLTNIVCPSVVIKEKEYINRFGYVSSYPMILSLNHISSEIFYINKRTNTNIKKLRLYNKQKKEIIEIMDKF